MRVEHCVELCREFELCPKRDIRIKEKGISNTLCNGKPARKVRIVQQHASARTLSGVPHNGQLIRLERLRRQFSSRIQGAEAT